MAYPFPCVYHCHTSRCGHAFGSDEEYVKAAIEAGFKLLCFTDHVPFKGIKQPGIRMEYEQVGDYVSSILSLKEKYKDKIEIQIGFEAEYSKYAETQFKELLNIPGVTHLIQGQHCYLGEDNELHWYPNKRDSYETTLNRYVEHLVEGMRSGLYGYLAHPDLFLNFKREWGPLQKEAARRIIESAIETNTVVEMNVHGILNHKEKYLNYPCEEFWMFASPYQEKGLKITLGVDAHSTSEFLKMDAVEQVLEIAHKAKINLLEKVR